nr:C20 [uncultured bacterium]ART38679.1 G75 [uncultured bacterium]
MSDTLHSAAQAALDTVIDPWNGASLKPALRTVTLDQGRLSAELQLGYPSAGLATEMLPAVRAALAALPGVQTVAVGLNHTIVAHAVQQGVQAVPGVKNVIAVGSGKGGVGKSTTAVNLALALAREGARVALLDADVYGPSLPTMLGVTDKPRLVEGDERRIAPLIGHGVQCMSIGFLIDPDAPMVWRGPMATQALEQLIRDTAWQDVDYLVVDLPPGTGDIQLTLAQRVPVSGAIIVTTPQDIALLDAVKGLKMFEKVKVPILGIVENMSTHICSQCGHEEHIFGAGGGGRMAEKHGVPLLGSLPLDVRIREQADGGQPTVAADPDGPIARVYREIALRAAASLARRGKDYARHFPKITVVND